MAAEDNPSQILAAMDDETLKTILDYTVRPIVTELIKRGFAVLITGKSSVPLPARHPRISFSITHDDKSPVS